MARGFLQQISSLVAVFLCVVVLGFSTVYAAGKARPVSLTKGTASGNLSAGQQASKVVPEIRVGLLKTQNSIALAPEVSYILRDAKTKQVLQKIAPGANLQLEQKNQQLLLNQKPIRAIRLEFVPQDAKKSGVFVINGKAYRGSLDLNLEARGIRVINRLGLEEYLYGVVSKEMPADWPIEALKAQAVAARTYALYSKNRHTEEGFDVCATTHCQVYGGIEAEKSAVKAAVDATGGQVLYYGGKPIDAFFHTDSGGMTENSEDVWGTYYPYLRAAKEDKAGTGAWKQKYTVPELQLKLKEAGYQFGVMKRIELTPLSIGKATEDRSQSGRVQLIKFFGNQGNASLTGNELRKILGLKSTLFDVRLEYPNLSKIDMNMGLTKKEMEVNLPAVTEKNLTQKKIHDINGKKGETIVIYGYGWGHGLGLSQWGAKALAAHMDYRAILSHYYQSTELKQLY